MTLTRSITRALTQPLTRAITDPGAGGGAAFVPDATFYAGRPGFALDYKDASTLFQNSGGTGAVTGATDPIGYAADISGNGRHATQVTGAARPLYYPALGAVCDGTKWMTVGTLDLSTVNEVFVVACVQTSSTATQELINHGTFNTGDFRVLLNSALGSIWATEMWLSYTSNPRGFSGPSFVVVAAKLNIAAASAALAAATRINGEAYGNSVNSDGSPPGVGNFASRECKIMVGYSNAEFVGSVARIGVIGGPLTTDEIFNFERWAGQGGGLSIISELPPAGVVDYSMMMTYGQSLSLGVSSTPLLSATRRFSNDFMFANGTEPWAPSPDYTALAPLAEDTKTISASDCGESPISGMVELLHERGFTGDTICTATGFPATAIAQLSVGTSQYNTLKSIILAAWRRSREEFKHCKALAFNWMQGESDSANSAYAADMNTLLGSLNTDIKATTLQAEDVWMLSYQLNSPKVGLQHLEASDTYARIRVTHPQYFLGKRTDIGDPVHMSNVGSKVAGAYFGLAYKAIILDGNTSWKPLQCTGSSVAAQTIDLTYNRSGLTFDTTIVAAQTAQGFRVLNAADAPLTVSSVTIIGSVVRIVVASGTPAKVYYGFDDPTSTTAALGNLRDSQGDTIVFDGGGLDYPMHNWAVLQNITL